MAVISPDTRLSQILDAVPGALEYIVALDPHDFERLKHPMLRRYMSPRISLRRVAAIAEISEERLLDDLGRLAEGLPVDQPPLGATSHGKATQAATPQHVPQWAERA